jgi:hypothetical protein
MTDTDQAKAVDEQYVLKQYESKINYYWAASSNNKKAYKRFRT